MYHVFDLSLYSSLGMIFAMFSCAASRYCPMLVTQGGVDLLSEMVAQPHLHPDVHRVATGVLEVVRQSRIAVASPCEIKRK